MVLRVWKCLASLRMKYGADRSSWSACFVTFCHTTKIAPMQALRRRKNLLPEPYVIPPQDQPDLIVRQPPLGQHLNKAVPVLAHRLGLHPAVGLRRVPLHLS